MIGEIAAKEIQKTMIDFAKIYKCIPSKKYLKQYFNCHLTRLEALENVSPYEKRSNGRLQALLDFMIALVTFFNENKNIHDDLIGCCKKKKIKKCLCRKTINGGENDAIKKGEK